MFTRYSYFLKDCSGDCNNVDGGDGKFSAGWGGNIENRSSE